MNNTITKISPTVRDFAKAALLTMPKIIPMSAATYAGAMVYADHPHLFPALLTLTSAIITVGFLYTETQDRAITVAVERMHSTKRQQHHPVI